MSLEKKQKNPEDMISALKFHNILSNYCKPFKIFKIEL